MDRRTLQMIQRGLIAAVSFVLALIVITAFRDILQGPDETAPIRTTTTVAPDSGEIDTTTTTIATAVTTTTTASIAPAICLEDEPTDEDATILQIYFPCGVTDLAIGGTYVYREVPPTDLVLTTTIRELTKGLETDEVALGFRSPFSEAANGSFLGVSLAEGTAFLEFNDAIFPAGADTAEGAQIFLSTLNANVFQFASISAVEYRIGGSCDAFWQRLGLDECNTITRSQWRSQLAAQ